MTNKKQSNAKLIIALKERNKAELISISSSLVLTILSFYLLFFPFTEIRTWHFLGLSVLLIISIISTVLARKKSPKKSAKKSTKSK